MHKFQPFPIDLLEFNPFNKIANEWALITAGSKIKSNTMTVSWGGVGELWGKHVVYIFIRESRYTKEFIDSGAFFTMAFLDDKYRSALQYCGANSGRNSDKFKDAGLLCNYVHGIPFPDEANLVLVCQKMAAVPITEENMLNSEIMNKWYKDKDMHTMYVGEIIEVLAR